MWRPAILLFCLFGLPALAETATGPRLGAASNFGQGWQPEMLDAAEALGVRDLRDAVYWDLVEVDGRRRFGTFQTRWPDLLAPRGMGTSLTVNNGHPDHDGGVTPHTPGAVAAFAGFAAALAAQFPAADAIEVGNEMNSAVFTSGPMREADLEGKARYYTALLRATHGAVKAERPAMRILGGAAHSIPLAWFGALSEAGAPAWMDAAVIHPYTTPPEQLRRQVALLRGVPGFGAMPLEVTEFGSEDAGTAAAHFVTNYCQMALSGVTRVVWYPLNPRGDGLVPLIGADLEVTAAGRAYRLIAERMEGRPVRDAAPDPFTYACRFGGRALVIWGAPRDVTLGGEGLRALDAAGAPVDAPRVSREAPLVIVSEGAEVVLGGNVILGPQAVLADSFDQFAWPGQPGDGFERFARQGGEVLDWELRGGQQRGGVPWTPYLGSARDGLLRMGADWILPARPAAGPIEVVHRWTAPAAGAVTVEARLAPAERSEDGVEATLTLNGQVLEARTVTGAAVLRHDLTLAAGDRVELSVGPGATARGDVTAFRLTISRR